jgi:hypothetical protein
LASVFIGFFIFVAATFIGMHGCTVVNVAAGKDASVSDDKGIVTIRPKGRE